MKLSHIFISALAAMSLASCSEWLDVKPSDRISESVNFSTLAGFKQALNGIYVELNSSELYGRSLSCEFIEVMAQRYAVTSENKSMTEVMNLSLGGTTAQSRIESIWGKAYNLISNANLIIENCEKNRDVLPDDYYHLIKGEAYALRAYLHLDLFRLFGYTYDPATSSTAVPYYDRFQLNVAPTLSSHEYMERVIKDLLVAEEELLGDPIVTYGVAGSSKDLFLSYRNLRLNLYAVQGVLARAYYYMQDDVNAAKYARKVIEVQERVFPWIQPIALTRANVDRVFSTEVMFALQNLSRESLYTSLFDGNSLKANALLAPREKVLKQIYEGTKSDGDYRVMASFKGSAELNGVQYRVFNKYHGTDSLYNQMIPMVRTSEAYLILAQVGDDNAERLQALNAVRNNRGLQSTVNPSELIHRERLTSLLDMEWIKEFYGEGQLFFWYKRNSCIYMRSAIDEYNDSPYQVSSLSKYVLPLPDAESKYN
ncbi:MAG: RagB/SusD family nutrient uptake outer membrane protein [Muribaculaceae bacterium]|nr:RagB/SusD family nutrient uptake outer membrane protein [Muribaculaceae bacterium]